MKKIKSIALSTIAVALFGSAAMANAADLTANTSVTTTVQERSGFTASYNEIRSIKETDLKKIIKFGEITLNGMTGDNLTIRNLELTDPNGGADYFLFTSPEGNSFKATIYGVKINGHMPQPWLADKIYNGYKLSVTTDFNDRLVPGRYSDVITVILNGQ